MAAEPAPGGGGPIARAEPARMPDRPRDWRAELRATIALGLPLIGAQLAQIGINTTDTVMMGRLGAEALAAGALGTTLLFLVIIVQIGLSAGVGTLVAQARGARASAVREPRRIVRQGFWAVTGWALLGMLALTGGERLLVLANQEPATAARAMDYLWPALWSLPFSGLYVVLRAFVLSLERTREVFLITLSAIVVNACLNAVLMFGHLGFPALGIAGTGIATAVTNAYQFAALAWLVTRDPAIRRYSVLGRFWRPDPRMLARVLRLGLPIALLLIAEVGTFAGSTAIAGMVGTQTLAAHAIALQVASVTFMVPLGLSQATSVRVGLAYGRGRGVALAGHVSLALGLVFAAVAALVMVAVPGTLVAAFIDADAAATTAALATSFLLFAALFQLVDAGQVVLAASLRGIGDTTVPLVLGVLGYWGVGLPLGALLALGPPPALRGSAPAWEPWGGLGVWAGLATGLAVVCALLAVRWMVQLARVRAARH